MTFKENFEFRLGQEVNIKWRLLSNMFLIFSSAFENSQVLQTSAPIPNFASTSVPDPKVQALRNASRTFYWPDFIRLEKLLIHKSTKNHVKNTLQNLLRILVPANQFPKNQSHLRNNFANLSHFNDRQENKSNSSCYIVNHPICTPTQEPP